MVVLCTNNNNNYQRRAEKRAERSVAEQSVTSSCRVIASSEVSASSCVLCLVPLDSIFFVVVVVDLLFVLF